ncbi:MAG: hypothetical protein LBQ31_05050 [Bacteroidales bacterium]|jgi:nitrous oxide reductase accessory protein NosL|nr:hypothetical protein [Bacteroidales bacterium]
MKRTIFLLSIVTAILLTSCGKEDPFASPYPDEIGKKLDDGIIFYVSKDRSYALICSYTDLQAYPAVSRPNARIWHMGAYTWGDFDRDTLLQKDTVWNVTSPTDSTILRIDSTWFFGFLGATSLDNGIENTDKIVNFVYPKKLGATAAKKCREYFYGMYVYNEADMNSSKWFGNKGSWYLPSLNEAKYLAHAKEKINTLMESDSTLYPNNSRGSSYVKDINRYGWEPLANCYWTSTERGASTAYYQCVQGQNGSLPDSYIPKNEKTFVLSIRPIRKVAYQ